MCLFVGLLHMDHMDYYYYQIWIRLLGFVFVFLFYVFISHKIREKNGIRIVSENNSFFRKSLKYVPFFYKTLFTQK